MEIINHVSEWSGSIGRAFAWFRSQPLASFGDKTAEDLVKEGRARAVKDYLSRIADGGLRLSIPVFRFKDTVYRAHHPMWAFDPLSGKGAKRYGGRFNRPETLALYTSLDLTHRMDGSATRFSI